MAAGGRVRLVGIDEAGLGPLLGSLTFGYTLLDVPEEAARPWQLLRGTVARKRGTRARIVVADSKLVFERNARGMRRLETTVLAFLAQVGDGRIEHSAEDFLLGRLAPPARWRELPWRHELRPLPQVVPRESLELSAALLARALARADVRLLEAGVRLVPADELNASFAETSNKASSVWAKVLEVLRHAWSRRGPIPLLATVDMLGGRRRYGSLLGRSFPEASVALVGETRGRSAYHLAARDGSGEMRLEFRVGADRACFEVALASCFAKYARELEVRAFNAFFARLQPDLLPTAGYRGDGARWLADAAGALARSGLPREVLVRER